MSDPNAGAPSRAPPPAGPAEPQLPADAYSIFSGTRSRALARARWKAGSPSSSSSLRAGWSAFASTSSAMRSDAYFGGDRPSPGPAISTSIRCATPTRCCRSSCRSSTSWSAASACRVGRSTSTRAACGATPGAPPSRPPGRSMNLVFLSCSRASMRRWPPIPRPDDLYRRGPRRAGPVPGDGDRPQPACRSPASTDSASSGRICHAHVAMRADQIGGRAPSCSCFC